MNTPSKRRRLSVRGIIVKGPLLFSVCLKHDGLKEDFWCTPGGGLEVDEDISACLERELVEEIGVIADIGALLYVQQFKSQDIEYLDFFFNIKNTDAFNDIDLSNTTHGVEEIAEYGFKSPQEINLLPIFLRGRNLQADILKGQTNIFNYL